MGDMSELGKRAGAWRVPFAGTRVWKRAGVAFTILAVIAASMVVSRVDPAALVKGLPTLFGWAARAIPPDLAELDLLALRIVETVAMAVTGTAFGAVLAIPLTLVGTRQLSLGEFPYRGARAIMSASRGIDSFVFAILFVAAVGLGPFAGVLGIALHSCGGIAKLWSEAIDTLDRRPALALRATGVRRLAVWRFAILPDALPNLTSTVLYVWEFNVRSSTVLGLVGAGGIGQELKNAVDLLMMSRLATILILIVVTISIIDWFSDYCRRKLL